MSDAYTLAVTATEADGDDEMTPRWTGGDGRNGPSPTIASGDPPTWRPPATCRRAIRWRPTLVV
ncbi:MULTISPECIES: hypothetical protein [Actinomadura]|uniref:hypothetical protein n=1 Tax=Actinomadura sp. NPDC000929 TaxID=3154517 RepID=UPI0033925148